MNKIDNLIQELCPDGVQYQKIDDVSVARRGKWIKSENLTPGDVPVITSAQESLYTHNVANSTGEVVVVASSGAYAGFISYFDTPIYLSNVFAFDVDKSKIDAKFLYYVLKSRQQEVHDMKSGGGVPNVYAKDVGRLKVPVPPLVVQKEIISILDKFTQLEAELSAELSARRKQYDYYRNQLLTFGSDSEVQWSTLGEIAIKISSGGTPKTSVSSYYGGEIPWLRTQEVDFKEIWDTGVKISESGLKNSSAKLIPKDCVIIAMYGATVGKSAINKIPLSTNQACANIQVNPEIADYKYAFHWVNHNYKNIKALGTGSQTNINAQTVRNFKIPVPPISEQKRIVSILDKFDDLVNDISAGLPAEINARRKQYEYYRAKLLSFQELSV